MIYQSPRPARIKLDIRRKPPQPRPDHAGTFTCACCNTTTETHEQNWSEWDEINKAPICWACIRLHLTDKPVWVQGMKGNTYENLIRLSVAINILESEISRAKRHSTAR